MLIPIPEMTLVAGLLSFDVPLGAIFSIALVVVLAAGLVSETSASWAPYFLRRRSGDRNRRLASASSRL